MSTVRPNIPPFGHIIPKGPTGQVSQTVEYFVRKLFEHKHVMPSLGHIILITVAVTLGYNKLKYSYIIPLLVCVCKEIITTSEMEKFPRT